MGHADAIKKADRLRLPTLVTIGVCATVVVTMLALLILGDHFATGYSKQQAYERLQQLSCPMARCMPPKKWVKTGPS